MSADTHSFNVKIAAELGSAHDAIILQHFWIWHQHNTGKDRSMKGDHPYPWTYNTVSRIAEIFPYMTEREVRLSIQRLVSKGYLITDNFNKMKFDRTLWYSLTDKSVKIYTPGVLQNVKSTEQNVNSAGHIVNSAGQIVNTIPDSRTDSNTNSRTNNKKLEDLKAGAILDDSFRRPSDITNDELMVMQIEL